MTNQIQSSGQMAALQLLQSAQAARAQRLAQNDSQQTASASRDAGEFQQALSQTLQTRPAQAAGQPAFSQASQPVLSSPVAPLQNAQADTGIRPRGVSSSAFEQLQPIISEVSQIAQNAGFVGVHPQEIVKAYYSGQSFLADYRV